ncbi:flagella synthesis protein FlgN [Undibacterium sp. SXout11W]|uniref:flagella synthesis protein FlgN n=1 Tax=Undibacterium sp. SXout11W TaxID=3413050 RepID=UPI003BF0753E
MTQASAQDIAIQQCLTEETEAMNALAALLKKEQLALSNGDIDTLNQTTASKSDLLRQIVDLEKIRGTHLGSLGFDTKPDGMQDYLSKYPETLTTAQLWKDLLTVSEQAKEDNRTNGLLINRRLSQNQIALSVLGHGNSAGALYGPSGQASLGSANVKGSVPR